MTVLVDTWLAKKTWPSPRLGLLEAADLRQLLAVGSHDPAAVQPFLPLLSQGAHSSDMLACSYAHAPASQGAATAAQPDVMLGSLHAGLRSFTGL